jgi:hypothetical protein
MLLRRVIEHVKAQNWTAVALDFVIVVMGVFIGIQVSNWNAARADSAKAESYLARIADDLSTVQTSMQSGLDMGAWVEAHMLSAIDALSAPERPATAEFLVDTYVSGYMLTGIVPRDSLKELMSSDAFDRIQNAETRERLKRFDRVAQNAEAEFSAVTDYQSRYRRAMPPRVIGHLRQFCYDGGAGRSLEGLVRFEVPDTCPPDLTTAQIEQSVENLLSEDLLPALREALADTQVKQYQYKIVMQESAALKKFLEDDE